MITRSRTRLKASAPATEACKSGHVGAKLLEQLAASASASASTSASTSTSTPCAEPADSDKRHSREPSNRAEAADAGAAYDYGDDGGGSSSRCLTPKGKMFRIPEISSCPPAPKKMRASSPCRVKSRSPIALFSPPELEFLLFLGVPSENNISVV